MLRNILRKPYLSVCVFSLMAMNAAHAEQWPGYDAFTTTLFTSTTSDELQLRPSYLNLDQNTTEARQNFEQVQSADDGDTRVNLAMNFLLQKKQKDEVNLQLGAVSLEFPEDNENQLAVDVRPFFYLGLGSRW